MPVMPDLPAAEAAIIEMTNAFRAQHKLAPVRRNPQLTAAARAYGRKLAGSRELSHTLDGTTHSDRIAAAGYQSCQSAENLASLLDTRGFTAGEYAKRAVEGWQSSPGHRKNMLLPFVTETGVAVVRASPNEPRYIAVQLFARPESTKYRFKVTNLSGRSVSYTFEDDANSIAPHEIVTHTACLPGTVAFDIGTGSNARYEAPQGREFTLQPTVSGGIAVEVK